MGSPQTLVSENFANLTNFFNAAGGSVASNILTVVAEGMLICKTPLSNGDIWGRVVFNNNVSTAHVINPSADGNASTGECLGAAFLTSTNPVPLSYIDRYSNFSAWDGDSNATTAANNGTNFVAGMVVGITFERATRKLRMWSHATTLAAQPDSVSSWGGVSATSTQTYDFSAIGGTYPSDFVDQGIYCGLGADSASSHPTFSAFTAGDFLGGGAAAPVDAPKLPNPMRPFKGIIGKVAMALRTIRPPAQTAPGSVTITATGIATSYSFGLGAGSAVAAATGQSSSTSANAGQGAALATAQGASLGTSSSQGAPAATAAATGTSMSPSTAAAAGSATGSAPGNSLSSSAGVGAGAATAAGAGASLSESTAVGTSSSSVTATGNGSTLSLSTAVGQGSALASANGMSASPSRAVGAPSSVASSTGRAATVSLASGIGAAIAVSAGLSASVAVSAGVGAAVAAAVGFCLALSRAWISPFLVVPEYPPGRFTLDDIQPRFALDDVSPRFTVDDPQATFTLREDYPA